MPTLRHVPGDARAAAQQCLAQALTQLCERKNLRSLWDVMAFPKLVLRGTGDPRSHPSMDASLIVLRRLALWEAGEQAAVWKEVERELSVAETAKASKKAGGGTPGPQTRPEGGPGG